MSPRRPFGGGDSGVEGISVDRDSIQDEMIDGDPADDAQPLPETSRHFTDTVQLRSAMDEIPVRRPAVPNTVSNLLPLAAAVALVVVGGLVTLLVSDGGGGDRIAGATLTNDGGAVTVDASATGALLDDGGQRHLRLNLDPNLVEDLEAEGSLSGDKYLALWLMDPTGESVIPLGVVDGDAIVTLPDTVDPAAYPVIDISIESLDGNPDRSGRTVLQGVLESS